MINQQNKTQLIQLLNKYNLSFFNNFIFSLLSIALLTSCPEPPESLDCGPHQIEVNGECECVEGYHWNEDKTECLMDTTSHNFVWEIDTLGDYGSYLNDVAIIDDNNVWIVGNIETDSMEYNAAHWDGNKWELIGIYSNTLDLYSIQYFDENDIWVTSHCFPYHWDGIEWTQYHLDNMGLDACAGNAIWGSSPNDVYFVGSGGSIVHYDGTGFSEMESGIDAPILDICGIDENHIWTVAYTNTPGIINKVLEYNGNTWSVIYEDRFQDNWPPSDYSIPSGTFLSSWAYGDTLYLGCASVYKQSITTGEGILLPLEDIHWSLGWGIAHIRGNNPNDIFITTGFGSEVCHYNGEDWHFYDELDAIDVNDFVSTRGLSVKGDMVVIVGEDNTTGKAIVYRGYR